MGGVTAGKKERQTRRQRRSKSGGGLRYYRFDSSEWIGNGDMNLSSTSAKSFHRERLQQTNEATRRIDACSAAERQANQSYFQRWVVRLFMTWIIECFIINCRLIMWLIKYFSFSVLKLTLCHPSVGNGLDTVWLKMYTGPPRGLHWIGSASCWIVSWKLDPRKTWRCLNWSHVFSPLLSLLFTILLGTHAHCAGLWVFAILSLRSLVVLICSHQTSFMNVIYLT